MYLPQHAQHKTLVCKNIRCVQQNALQGRQVFGEFLAKPARLQHKCGGLYGRCGCIHITQSVFQPCTCKVTLLGYGFTNGLRHIASFLHIYLRNPYHSRWTWQYTQLSLLVRYSWNSFSAQTVTEYPGPNHHLTGPFFTEDRMAASISQFLTELVAT
jgi:hypothetical protein